jgi:hypothetical protein
MLNMKALVHPECKHFYRFLCIQEASVKSLLRLLKKLLIYLFSSTNFSFCTDLVGHRERTWGYGSFRRRRMDALCRGCEKLFEHILILTGDSAYYRIWWVGGFIMFQSFLVIIIKTLRIFSSRLPQDV